ncbi:hypothetical protein GCM10011611_48700 [Aliidongia dinghuensis]|uniref:histidine kinase n=1 Tax=Aliidongia dinghuensis TaxID=1867774 RepID=A0A8J2YXL7_9PROT|nr:response regulator [Aliidongia dinghuensis]GGF36494.1 hypothetical protein GCM10011611_48700 [Aliidongia dinghuensis]
MTPAAAGRMRPGRRVGSRLVAAVLAVFGAYLLAVITIFCVGAMRPPAASADGIFQVTLVCLAIALGLAILVALQMARVLVRRLDGLRVAMNASAEDDEVAALGQAFQTLATARDAAERALAAARAEAAQATRAKDEFLANMSHEIRTPLNGIMGFATLLRPTRLDRGQADHVEKILRSAEHLAQVIDDILDFSQSEAGRLELDPVPFDLCDVLATVSDILGSSADGKGIVFETTAPESLASGLIGDRLRLVQVLVNLAGNAIKFTDGGSVVLAVSVAAEDSDTVNLRFVVRDTGIGMTAEQLESLFDKFCQGDASTTRRFGGTGLGLALSKHLIELMGGEIAVASEPGVGSTFSFTLRFSRAAEPLPRDLVLPDGIGRPRILLAGGDARSRARIGGELTQLAFLCTTVATGRAAVEECAHAELPFDLMILDEAPDGPNGAAAAREIAALAGDRRPPLILLTDRAGPPLGIASAGTDRLFARTLAKPVRPADLFDAIVEVLDQARTAPPEPPLAPAPPERATAEPPRSDEWRDLLGRRVLLVDDQPLNREVATVFLRQQGMLVEVVVGGREAVERVLEAVPGHFDAVLMDVQMPEMDGFQATRLIRKTYAAEELPIIAMTAHSLDEQRTACLEAGMNDHIAKPIEVKRLWGTLRQWMKPRTAPSAERAVLAADGPRPAVSAPTGLPDRLDGFDLTAGVAHAGGDDALFRKLLGDFPKWARAAEEQVRQALARTPLARQDLRDAEIAAHGLVGMAASVAAMRVAAAARVLERTLGQGEIRGLDEQFRELQGALDEACAGIAALAAPVEPAAPAPVPSTSAADPDGGNFPWPDRRAALTQILRLLDSQDFEAETRFHEFLRHVRDEIPARALQAIGHAIDELDFRRAAFVVRGLLDAMDGVEHG